jgi:hypothetical protein
MDLPKSATIIAQIHNNKTKTNPIHTIINIYRKPQYDKDFTNNLQKVIDDILTKNPTTSITIQGDINYDLLKLKPTDALTHLIQENDLYTTITTPTRYDQHHKTSSLIDVTLTTLKQTKITSGTISPPLSDHLPTYATFHKTLHKDKTNNKPTLTIHQYEKKKETILMTIKKRITDDLDTTLSTNEQLDNIQLYCLQTIEQYEKKPKPPRKPWCNPTIKRKIRKQHKLHEQKIKHPTEINIQKHSIFRNKLKTEIQQAKKQHVTNQLEQTKKNPKQQAKVLKSLIPSNKTPRQSPTSIKYENTTYTDPTDIANALNDFFITIGHKTSQTIIPKTTQQQQPPTNKPPPFELKHTNLDKMTKNLKHINPNKASDIYKIKPIIIKDLATFLAPIITTHFNNAIDEHEYPNSLKLTKVIEVYKAKDKTLPENYRPISILPIIAKIFDQEINNQIMEHAIKHNILSRTQYAFRPNSNTTLALQTIINKLHKSKENRQATTAIYIDLSKAYDTVSHRKLLQKLKHDFNFTPNTISFIETYFKDRLQSTHTQNAKSKTQKITDGIPQGSKLSTTFFLLYINDIIKKVPDSNVYTYADDTTLIISTTSIPELQKLAQSELDKLIDYFNDNNLVPNPTKTNYSIFYPKTKNNSDTLELKIGNTVLQQNKKTKLLGIYIQEDLKLHETIGDIIRKLQPTIQSFKYANKLTTTKIMKQLYYRHIYPYLIGSISIWGTDKEKATYMLPLIRTHKKIIRLIVNKPPRTHTKPIMNKLEIMNLQNLYIHRVCTEVQPYIHPKPNINRPEHNHYYTTISQIHDHQTRSSTRNQIFNDQSNKEGPHYASEHLTQKYVRIWNLIPQNLREIKETKKFKLELKKYLLDKQKLDHRL